MYKIPNDDTTFYEDFTTNLNRLMGSAVCREAALAPVGCVPGDPGGGAHLGDGDLVLAADALCQLRLWHPSDPAGNVRGSLQLLPPGI